MRENTRARTSWTDAYERRLLSLTGLGGVAVGLGILLVSPPGFDGSNLLVLLALGVGIWALATLLLDKTDPIPVLVVIVILVGVTGPFVDLATAMALSSVVVGVVATGALLIQRLEGAVALIALGLIAVAIRPVLDTFGYLDIASPASVGVPWIVALVAVMMTALGFRALRDQLIRRDAHQRQIRDLVENTAYQVKGPLTAALGFAYLLRSELAGGEAAEYADGVIRRGWEVSLGLDDLMIVSRAESGDLEVMSKPVDVGPVLEACIDDVLGARVKLRHLAADGLALGDPVRVRQIVRHLISNAVVHGGADMSIHGEVRGSSYELRVHDNGNQLDVQEREKMFQPFVKLRRDDARAGRGVGLAVSKILASAMGGDLRMEPASDGNTAVLTLRAAPRRPGLRVETVRLRDWANPWPT